MKKGKLIQSENLTEEDRELYLENLQEAKNLGQQIYLVISKLSEHVGVQMAINSAIVGLAFAIEKTNLSSTDAAKSLKLNIDNFRNQEDPQGGVIDLRGNDSTTKKE